MGLRFDPISGGQFNQAIQQTLEAESQPIKSLNAKKTKEEARVKLFQDFKSKFSGLDKAISEIDSFRKFRELKAELGDGANLVSVTLDKERADTGTYSIEVKDLAARSSVISNGFKSPDEAVFGAGNIYLKLEDGDSTTIHVDDKGSSLRGIATAINRTGASPVRASVIKDASDPDKPWKLVLTAKKEGIANQVETPDFDFPDSDADLSIKADNDAKNAEISLDGFPIELESNDVTDFVSGVNLHLKQAKPGSPFTMTISEDIPKISGKIKTVVEQVNQVLQFIQKQNAIDDKTDTSTTFAGDTSLQSIEYRLRNLLQGSYVGTDRNSGEQHEFHLTELGVEFDKTGQVSFKEDKFNKAIEKNFDLISDAIAGPQGFAGQARTLFNSFTRSTDGALAIKEKGLRDKIKQIDDQIEQKTRVLEKRKQDLIDRFSRLESTIGNLQKQQQYLAAALPGAAGGNPITQLIGG